MTPDPRLVALVDVGARAYPPDPPYHPGERYPEYPLPPDALGPPNRVYAGLRALFLKMGLDRQRFGTPDWNPLGAWIRPGDRVVIKPNLVLHEHETGGSLEAVITHGSLVRAVADYALIALRGSGELTIGDAPLQLTDFERVAASAALPEIQCLYRQRLGSEVRVVDFRREWAEKDARGLVVARSNLRGDPRGYRPVDLDGASSHAQERRNSRLYSADYFGFRVTNYDPLEMLRHHGEKVHEYLIAGSVLDADVVIGLPKLKTHRKAGLTCALKNMVGINGNKDWLPHHTAGSSEEGGDEYLHRSARKRWLSALTDRIEGSTSLVGKRALYWVWRGVSFSRRLRPYRDRFSQGSWYGNSTLWRTILDLNAILMFADREGRLLEQPQRRLLHVADAVIAGEGEGPLAPDSRPCGLLLGGSHAAAVDAAAAALMGFDPALIPSVARAFDRRTPPLAGFRMDEVRLESDVAGLRGPLKGVRALPFRPPEGWQGHIERPPGASAGHPAAEP